MDLTLRDPNADLADMLGAEVLPTGSLRLRDYGKVSAMPGYAKGAWWVQDAAAALPAKLLDTRPGESVLDLCAAPGGKTMQLASAGAEVTALDISEDRMARVAENLERTSLDAEQVIADATKWKPKRTFDAILLDAPCSATGTLRRHPDLAHAKDGSGLGELVALQAEMIARAVKWLKPGGRMVYCTCSLLPDEGEEQLKNALSRHPELSVELPDAPWIEPEWHSSEGGLRIRPDHWAERGGIDGFFIALLKKKS